MSTETTTTERAPVRLTPALCEAMPLGTELLGCEGYWNGASYVKTSDLTWAMFMARPTPDDLWEAVKAQRNHLSPHPSGLAYVYEPTDYFATGDSVRRIAVDFSEAALRGMLCGRTYTVRDNTVRHDGTISVEGVPGMWSATGFELVARAKPQPAPEPEPEWEPGTLAEATVHGYPGIRVWRVEGGEPPAGWTTHVPVDDATWHSDADVTDVRPLVVLDPAATKCPECGDGLFVALHDDEQSICRTCTTREMERLELESARAGKTVVHVTKATTQEELADALARHYGDHAGLAAIVEQSTRQNYLSDARSVLAILGGGE